MFFQNFDRRIVPKRTVKHERGQRRTKRYAIRWVQSGQAMFSMSRFEPQKLCNNLGEIGLSVISIIIMRMLNSVQGTPFSRWH